MKQSTWLKIVVLTVAFVFAATLSFAAGPQKTAKPAAASPAKAELIDINTAYIPVLAALPGVGEAYARKIVSGRPYESKDQLKTEKIIPDEVFNKIKDKIFASPMNL
jgi:DNA uptake protein ComE-like DNA-binding protein